MCRARQLIYECGNLGSNDYSNHYRDSNIAIWNSALKFATIAEDSLTSGVTFVCQR